MSTWLSRHETDADVDDAPPSSTTLRVSEMFESVQGEGPNAGQPAAFLRLALCNLRCSWCDTRYTWDFEQYRYQDEVRSLSAEQCRAGLAAMHARRLVVTGGEPLLQQRALAGLLAELGDGWRVEVETNGTRLPNARLLQRVEQWNVSPKLSSAGDASAQRIRLSVLRGFRELDSAWLKLVIHDERDLVDADRLVTELAWPAARVFFMPEAATRRELQARRPDVEAAALARRVRFTSRLHIERWDGARGR